MESFREMLVDNANTVKRQLGVIWNSIQIEITEFFKNLPDMNVPKDNCNFERSKEKILSRFKLTEENIENPLYLPRIKELIFYIKEVNFNCFYNNWSTTYYNHHAHSYTIRDEILPKLETYSEDLIKFNSEKLTKLLLAFEHGEIFDISPGESYITYDFKEYGLKQYGAHLEIMNQIHTHDLYSTLMPFLLRNLFENLIHDILSQSLHAKHKELYYLQGRIKRFSTLISILDECRKPVFGHLVKGILNDDLIKNLHDVREKGNLTVHEVVGIITKEEINELKPKINLMVEQLLTIYEKVKGKNLEIDPQIDLNIKKKIGMISTKKKENNIPRRFTDKPNYTVENPIQELFTLFSRPGIETHLAKKIAIQIKKIGEEKFLEVLKFHLRESTTSHSLGLLKLIENLKKIAQESERYLIFEDEFFIVSVRYKRNANRIRISHKKKMFDYSKPKKNQEIRVAFLKSFRERCGESKIILREER